jgi:hypothetical protein
MDPVIKLLSFLLRNVLLIVDPVGGVVRGLVTTTT